MGHTQCLPSFNMVMVDGMHTVTPGQNKAFVFGMNGSGMYGTNPIFPKGTYCVQIFKDGPIIDEQWPTFNATHKSINFSTDAPDYTSCAAAASGGKVKPMKGQRIASTATQIKNPILTGGQTVGAGSWFDLTQR